MFLILPLLLFSRLLLSLPIALLCSCYGVGLILLAMTIRNVRQETSRNALRQFLNYVALDHLLAAATAMGCGAILTQSGAFWLPSMGPIDLSDAIGMATGMGFAMVVFLFVGVLLLMMNSDLRASVSLPRQLRWGPWTNVLVIIGLVLSLSTFFCVLVVSVPLLWHLHKMGRVGRQSSLIWTLAIAVRRGLPLGTEVEALANGLWGKQRLRLQLLAENLNAGVTLSAALERQPGLVPLSALMLIRMGEETNCLASALDNCAVGFTRKFDRQVELIGTEQSLLLLLVPLLVIPQIVGFLCYYIVPKFKKIFEDFGMQLPAATINMIYVADMVVRYSPMFLGVGLIAGVVIALYMFTSDWERDWPLLNTLAPRLNGPPILRGLALLMRQQRPLEAGVQAMSWSHPRRSARRRLQAIQQDLSSGIDLADSLARQRLIRAGDAALLKTAERVRNQPWVLDQLAEMMEHKFWYRVRLLMEICYPVGIILVGVLVLGIALAFFMPLVSLINSLS